jgi:hypothetical protein
LAIKISMPLSTTFTVDIADVQVEKGAIATDFERRPFGNELTMSQRYYCKSYNVDTNPGATDFIGNVMIVANSNGYAIGYVGFPVDMRSIPIVTVYNPNTGSTGTVYDWSGANRVGSATRLNKRGFNLYTDTNTGDRYAEGHYTADAEFY